MASCSTSRVNGTSPYVTLEVIQKSSTSTQVTIEYKLKYIAPYPAYTNGIGRSYSIVINGKTVKTGTYNINNVTGTRTITTGTTTVTKGSSSKNVAFSVTFNYEVTWGGTAMGTRSADSTIEIGSSTAYTITYNANGGDASSLPSSQKKSPNESISLSSSKPTHPTAAFLNWNTDQNGSGTTYNPGDTYSTNANVTLYAQWSTNSFSITYLTNKPSAASGNVSNMPSDQTKALNVDLTLSNSIPSLTGYTFMGWATSTSGTVSYSAGSTYTKNASATLYAVWTKSGTSKPVISDATVKRCNSNKSDNEYGTYAKVTFSWTSTSQISSATISGTGFTTVSLSLSGNSGTVSDQLIGGSLNPESSYEMTITLTNSAGTSTMIRTIVGTRYLIDFKYGGTGIAIGKTATEDNLFDVGWKINSIEDIVLANSKYLYGKNSSGTPKYLIGCSSSNNIAINSDNQGDTNVYAGGYINLHPSNGQGTIIQLFRESSGTNPRTILRPETNGGAYLGTDNYRWNTVYATNSLNGSDLKEKDVIEDFDFKSKKFVMGLKPIAYRRTGPGDTGVRIHMGLGAQTLNSLIKELELGDLAMVQASISENGEERPYHGEEIDDENLSWAINYIEILPSLILVLQENIKEIERLNIEIENLKSQHKEGDCDE